MPETSRQNDDVRRVRDATDIVRMIGEHVALKPRGREYVGRCPFHDDHRPSMYVVPAKGIFHCFVCGAGGDALSFVQRFLGMDFRGALEFLAERAGIRLIPRGAPAAEGAADRVSPRELFEANQFACDFFRAVFAHAEHGRAGREAVERRRIAPEMVRQFQVGVAPDRWDGLLLKLRSQSRPPAPFLELGLLRARDSGEGFYDFFRNRLIFPIQDRAGRVVAFGARRLNEQDEPKYVNSNESAVFDKSSTLFGLFQATRSIQEKRLAIVTEGYTDTIACHQAGITNAVATLGTALTRGHASELRRLCDTVVLLFDGDEAGRRAADRAVEIFIREGLDVKVATLASVTDAKDPDELLQRPGGRETLLRAVEAGVDLLEFRYRRLAETLHGAGPAAIQRVVLDDLSQLEEFGLSEAHPIRQQLVVRRLTELSGVSAEAIAAARRRIRASRRAAVSASAAAGSAASPEGSLGGSVGVAPSARELWNGRIGDGEHALGCVLCRGVLWSELDEAGRELLLRHAYGWPLLTTVAQTMSRIAEEGREPCLGAVMDALGDGEASDCARALAWRIEVMTEEDREPDVGDHGRLGVLFADAIQRLACERPHVVPETGDAAARLAAIRMGRAARGLDLRRFPKPAG